MPWGTKCAEHRLYPAAILALDEALTAAESNENVRAVVLTAEGKCFATASTCASSSRRRR